jgi:ubiquitin carboxyl-terminal hydrolase 7
MNCLFLLLCILTVGSLIRTKNDAAGALVVGCDAKKFAAPSNVIVSNGLRNVGNTCYMNAQLQCAFHIPAVRDIVLSPPPLPSDDNNDDEIDISQEQQQQQQQHVTTEALLSLKELFEGMVQTVEENSFSAYMPRSFCKRLGIKPMIQQDSQEFWKLLLPAVGSEKLSDLYKGVYEDYISALDGSGRERRKDDVFLDLSLDVTSSSTLLDSIKEAFGEPELLSNAEGNGWRPEKGADKVDAHKGSSLVAKGLPPILQFHLKRFNYDWQTDTTTKLNKRFTFPKSIDLAPICIDTKENDDSKTAEYELQAVVVHMGEYGVGHYYAYVRPDIESNIWYRFNDDNVEEVTFKDVKMDAFGGPNTNYRRGIRRFFGLGRNKFGWGGAASNAYVVQYVRRCDIQSLYHTPSS